MWAYSGFSQRRGSALLPYCVRGDLPMAPVWPLEHRGRQGRIGHDTTRLDWALHFTQPIYVVGGPTGYTQLPRQELWERPRVRVSAL